MPTVLDSLVLEFNLDTSQFTREQQRLMDQLKRMEEETKTRAVDIEARFKQMSNLFSNMQRGAMGVIGGFFGAEALQTIQTFANLEAGISRVAEVIGQTEERTLAMRNAFRAIGEDPKAGIAALMQTSSVIQQALFTGDVNSPLFRGVATLSRPGMRPLDLLHGGAGGGPMTAEQAMISIAQRLDELGLQGPARAARLQYMGLPQFMLMQSAAQIRKLVDEMAALAPLAHEEGERAKQFQQDIGKLDTAFEHLGMVVTNLATGPLSSLMEFLAQWLEGFSRKGPGVNLFDWFTKGDDAIREAGKRGAAAAGGAAIPVPGGGPAGETLPSVEGGGNWSRWLGALSYLETDQRNIGNTASSAQGYFQFLSGTARMAGTLGIGDPRFGTYEQQAGRTRQYIERRYPGAAEAIERGDWLTATKLLSGEWPSLPGGQQQQTRPRYRQWYDMLQGKSPSRTSNNHVSFNIQNMNVNGSNAHEVATNIGRNAERIKMAYYGNSAAV